MTPLQAGLAVVSVLAAVAVVAWRRRASAPAPAPGPPPGPAYVQKAGLAWAQNGPAGFPCPAGVANLPGNAPPDGDPTMCNVATESAPAVCSAAPSCVGYLVGSGDPTSAWLAGSLPPTVRDADSAFPGTFYAKPAA